MSLYSCHCQLNWFGNILFNLAILQVYPCRRCLLKERIKMEEEKKKYGRYLLTSEREEIENEK